MTRVLPALHEGHASIYLHQADEPTVMFEEKNVPISSIFGRMRTCFDIVPERLRATVADIIGRASEINNGGQSTFAETAVVLRAMCVERLRDQPA
ncbi:hypothetical protein [Mesorhizobium sp. M1405]|uniref:hypothetical protein n=1 Tax=unclassified Mesorhizobium TaxID=325217 RepID=UPI00333BC2D7